jgi:hypothetical protein
MYGMYQVLVHVDVGPGDAGHAVEPEACEGRKIPHRYLLWIVDVSQPLVEDPHEELNEDLELNPSSKFRRAFSQSASYFRVHDDF